MTPLKVAGVVLLVTYFGQVTHAEDASSSKAEDYVKGGECKWKGVECVPYEIVLSPDNSINSDYEERAFGETKWISVRTHANSLFDAKRRSFRKLIYYIQGFNDQNVTVDLTTPHRTMTPRHGRKGEYAMAFPLPRSLYDNPPVAFDEQIKIETEPPRSYLVRRFSGLPSESQWMQQADTLYKESMHDNRVIRDHYYTARYDLIFFASERRNEIWIPLKSDA